ncbi:hypothetical protein JVT61DRAFT_10554 [Boletus reticuloceps]|uniref:Uncharacterized protein n=1 Tax=Boletus reticuloceps TaxID=495285 RepID=A0A8I2YXK3_9AGAM|nr:hypothetical protein JVT61DRAFT_10554 [Boletus reticuloceps]
MIQTTLPDKFSAGKLFSTTAHRMQNRVRSRLHLRGAVLAMQQHKEDRTVLATQRHKEDQEIGRHSSVCTG